ncbi:MAG: 1-acyl-sn-glycerol-3-phosphate acyltransferase [Bacteroidales bacterium]|nr:1-acyl-sn-glycerol-3-phosphate acyltransferase [Bacteroidales bacterium]
MAKIHSESILYNILRFPVDACTRRMFRKMRTSGKSDLPKDGVLILTPNHCNTLLDALVVLQGTHRPTAFGARADIFRNPKIAALLNWLRMVPMARFRDGLSEVKKDFAVFDEAAECAIAGVPFCVFPEGKHTPGYEVQPIKSGAFRIVEAAQEKTDKKVYVVPIGLSYSDFYRPKPDIYIRYGKAIPADEIMALPPKERSEKLHEAIQELVIKPDTKEDPLWLMILKWLLSIVFSPIILSAILLSCPIWITSEAIVNYKVKDKAWSNTVRYACRLIGTILFTIIYGVLGFVFLPWWGAIALILFFWIAPNFFYQLFR